MNIRVEEEFKGQLGLRYSREKEAFEYVLTYADPPHYEPQIIEVQEGDHLIIRDPENGSIVLERTVDLDWELNLEFQPSTGVYLQKVLGYPVDGIQKDIESGYWLNLFTRGYFADLTKYD